MRGHSAIIAGNPWRAFRNPAMIMGFLANAQKMHSRPSKCNEFFNVYAVAIAILRLNGTVFVLHLKDGGAHSRGTTSRLRAFGKSALREHLYDNSS